MGHPAAEIIIVGAGVSGLLLAQHLRKSGIAFRIFERDADLAARGVGWGLTLHWSLPALRSLLPDYLVQRLPETYVNRGAVEAGQSSTFPFYDLSTGELKAATPVASEAQRIRVSRDRFRRLLATGIDVQWAKVFNSFESGDDFITVHFDDGSAYLGSLLVACDGASSRARRALFPQQPSQKIPIRLIGIRVEYSPTEMEPMQKLDPIFLQGTASENDTYVFFSVLDAPGSPVENQDKYVCQIAASWPIRDGFFGAPSPIPFPSTTQGGVELIKKFANTWAEPFRSLVEKIPEDADVKFLEPYDWTPPRGFRGAGRVALVGDAFHPMAMYRGEGANHAFVDVLDLTELVVPPLTAPGSGVTELRAALDGYEDAVTARCRPAVLASRQACMDAHEWGRVNGTSPLLSRRVMKLDFETGVE
ncbi:hypothetical protein B0H67DRAFT_673879 [Lasiosphaeris hirsuta]|uniref:FAD-binding domain-containing protein n=1 Tax=Lasiosphaeris hirsuta TaxID=260670 RepID=A0AA39ZVU9_9PEZI|nr:hypothetical protein B0H67DRAFT_673879 [Lasiosphaeris hirsuta]